MRFLNKTLSVIASTARFVSSASDIPACDQMHRRDFPQQETCRVTCSITGRWKLSEWKLSEWKNRVRFFSSQTELSFSSHLFTFISLRFFSSLSLMKFQQRRHDLSGTNRLFFLSFLIFSCAFFHTDFKSRCNLSLPNLGRFVDMAVVSKKKTSII